MQGNLKQIQLPEVLQFISMGKSTGKLSVRDSEGHATTLMIRQGKIINSSALERQRRLGELLVHRGILKRSVLAQLLSIQRTVDSNKKLGEILVERDIIKEETIRDVLRLQLEEEIWNLFGLEEGDFKFEQAETNVLGEALLEIDIEPLLLEGTRRQDEWRKIIKLLPSDQLVVGLRDIRQLGNAVKEMKLSTSEWNVLAQINGKIPLRGIINRSGMGRFEVYRILFDFMNKKLIYVKDPQQLKAESQRISQSKSSEANPQQATRGVGGFFSILTGSGKREEKGSQNEFLSPIGSLSTFANRLTEHVMSLREWKPQDGDKTLIEDTWRELIVNFTKADLLEVRGNTVNPRSFETYLEYLEFGEAAQDCYEDSVEALLQLIDALYRIFGARVGERPAARSVKEILDDMGSRVRHRYGTDFKLDERIQGVLRIAA